jgi:glutamate---cysteine ligase / carboxylate-amine ligase
MGMIQAPVAPRPHAAQAQTPDARLRSPVPGAAKARAGVGSPCRLPPFAASRRFTLGVELELQIVEPHGRDLAPRAAELLALVDPAAVPGEVKPEITCSMVELSTGVCADSLEARTQLRHTRNVLLEAAARVGVGLAGGGTHPFQQWSDRRIYDTPRFREVSERYGYLSKQFTVFGQHVHVGCADGDEALVLLQGLSRYVPHLIALAASSPFVQGVDTGFDSARLNSVFAFPLAGRAPAITRWSEFEGWFERMAATGMVSGMKDFYWDIRPKPEFGTVEVRVLDTPLAVDKAAALAGLLQCLARQIVLEPGASHVSPQPLDDQLPYVFNRFQACRYGVEAEIVDSTSGERQHLRTALLALFDRLDEHASDLGARWAIDLLREDLVRDGNDATWLRAQRQRNPRLADLVRQQEQRFAGEGARAQP